MREKSAISSLLDSAKEMSYIAAPEYEREPVLENRLECASQANPGQVL
jgi:hypothetical protein